MPTNDGRKRSIDRECRVTGSRGSIDGTWKADIDSVQFDQKPDEYLLQAGQYSCKSCAPTYTVAADGAFHAVSLPYADSMSVKVDDDHNITRTARRASVRSARRR